MRLQRFWGSAATAVLLATAAAAQAPDLSKMDIVQRAIPDGPVASVRGKSISARDYREQYTRSLAELSARAGAAGVDDATRLKLGMQVLRTLVGDEILVQDAEARKLQVPADDFEKAWQNELNILKEQTQKEGKPASSEAELLQRAGTTREAAQAELRKAMLISRMREELAKSKNVTVSDAEVDKYIKEHAASFDGSGRYHVRHILIRPDTTRGKLSDADLSKARNEAEQALARIQSGQSFESVAKEVSDGPRKDQGGDMGFLPLDDMGPVLSAAVKKLKPGEVSGIIQSDYGFHIVQLVEVQSGQAIDMSKAKPRIQQGLKAEKADQIVQQYVQQTAEKSEDVKVYLRLDKQLATRPDLQKEFLKAAGK
jgi:parvulin-like peptidyl-prolyl isomerase